MDLDTLWQVEDEFLRVSHWSTTVSPDKRAPNATSVFPKQEIADGSNSDDSLPALIEASISTPNNSVVAGSDDDSASDLDGEERNEYDSEEEAELQDLEREAMDIASAHPDIFEEKKAFDERSNDNQLLKALGALRGKYLMSTFEMKDVGNPEETELRPPIFL